MSKCYELAGRPAAGGAAVGGPPGGPASPRLPGSRRTCPPTLHRVYKYMSTCAHFFHLQLILIQNLKQNAATSCCCCSWTARAPIPPCLAKGECLLGTEHPVIQECDPEEDGGVPRVFPLQGKDGRQIVNRHGVAGSSQNLFFTKALGVVHL